MNPIAAELRAIARDLATAATPKSLSEPPKVAGRPDMRTDHDRLNAGAVTALARLERVIASVEGD